MNKPDLLVCWPRSCDYPLWRQMIRDNRHRFEKVIIVFTETHYGDDYREFVMHAMKEDNCIFVDCLPIRGDQDWRDVSVNAGLMYSTANWIWFTEQDFLPTSDQFWTEIYYLARGYEVFGAFADKRLHPCCIFMNKKMLEEIPKRFGVLKNKLDHFGQIQQSLEVRGINIATIRSETYHNMNGLSQNYSMAFGGAVANYHPDEFNEYLEKCLKVSVPQ